MTEQAARAALSAPFMPPLGKPGPMLSSGDESPLSETRQWNAGRRARPQAEGGASRFSVVRTARRLRAGNYQCVCRRSASFFVRVILSENRNATFRDHAFCRGELIRIGSYPKQLRPLCLRGFVSFIIAGQKARDAVLTQDHPAIHADGRPTRIYREAFQSALQHGPPGQAQW